MIKLAILGASYLQEPLIQKAKKMGIQTHVFAWKSNDVGEKSADFFYPISIVEKEKILCKCREIGIDGICSIASDLASVTVNYVANEMGLTGNSMECAQLTTNKHCMRECFEKNGDPSPKSICVTSTGDLQNMEINYPVIVKPLDRSGSRGITMVEDPNDLEQAIEAAKQVGFDKRALVEEFVQGEEYSVECISWMGEHQLLAITKKYTTGAPHFIEVAHLEPAGLNEELLKRVRQVVFHALDSLRIKNGASHTEVKIDSKKNIVIIEVGARMGGDCIGSDLVELTTGIDYVQAVVQTALGKKPDLGKKEKRRAAAIRFVLSEKDKTVWFKLQKQHPEYIMRSEIGKELSGKVTDSSNRHGYYLLCSEDVDGVRKCLMETYS